MNPVRRAMVKPKYHFSRALVSADSSAFGIGMTIKEGPKWRAALGVTPPRGQLRSNRSQRIPHAILKPCHSDAERQRNLPHHLSLEQSEPFASATRALAGDNADRHPQVRWRAERAFPVPGLLQPACCNHRLCPFFRWWSRPEPHPFSFSSVHSWAAVEHTTLADHYCS